MFLSVWLLAGVVAAHQCPTGNGIAIIVARGSTEPPGTGSIGNISSNAAEQLTGSIVLAVDYPATLSNYSSSEEQGVASATKLIQDYNKKCPGKKLVLMGYSQGAQVMTDVLCGTSEEGFNTTAPVAVSDCEHILMYRVYKYEGLIIHH